MSQSPSSPRPSAPELSAYPHRIDEIVRFGDLDSQGHVNNAVYATYFESGRVGMFREPNLGIGVNGATFVLVRQEIDYLRELNWPANIVVGTALVELGRSSFKMAQAIFRDGVAAATCRATLVMMDLTTRRSRPLTPEAIAKLEPWRYRGA